MSLNFKCSINKQQHKYNDYLITRDSSSIAEPVYFGHHWDQVNCPDYRDCPHFRGELILQNTVWDISKCQRCPHFGELGKERFHCIVKPLNCNVHVYCNRVIVNVLLFTGSHDHHVSNDFLLLRELNGVLNT